MSRVLDKQEQRHLYRELALGFFDDRLYEVAFPNTLTRAKIMKQFFKIYMKAMMPYSVITSDSIEKHSVIVVYDSRLWKPIKYTLSMVVLNMRLVTLLPCIKSWKLTKHALRCYGMFTSSWVKDFALQDYYHLDLLVTKRESRGKGYGSALVKDLIALANEEGMDITLETHELENVSYYERFGFVLVKTFHHDGYDISQYCMLKRYQEDIDEDNKTINTNILE